MTATRRRFIRDSGLLLLSFQVGACDREMTPGEARDAGLPLRVLDEHQAATLEALGDVLLPGAANAGIAHFIDHQLAADPPEQLLMLKYLGANPPFTPFYAGGIAGLDAAAETRHQQSFKALSTDDRTALVATIGGANPDGWEGPPAPFFYFVLRADAVDVVYGTRDGIESLGVPYMAHIDPPSRWGE